MNISSSFKSLYNVGIHYPAALLKTIILLLLFALLFSCEKESSEKSTHLLAGAYSIVVDDGNVMMSGFRTQDGQVSPRYWINGEHTDETNFLKKIGNNTSFRKSIDEKFRRVYTYKTKDGVVQNYQFDQGSLINEGKIFYYKDDVMITMSSDSIGSISSVDFSDGTPYFAGYFGQITSSETGKILRPLTPFVWDGASSVKTLPLPDQASIFHGISTIYHHNPEELFVSALCGVPMYWKDTEPVLLDERYGEIWQITKSETDLYAVGLVNKYNSNSTGHTACYWKNDELHELEDDAQAYGIYLDGEDIYVCGAVGRVPIDYKPCYWKNGVRVDLPI